jgi:hypothetical protein
MYYDHRHLFHSKNICPLIFLNETSTCDYDPMQYGNKYVLMVENYKFLSVFSEYVKFKVYL